MFLILEYENGDLLQEEIENDMEMKEVREIAIDALDDAPIVYIYPSYNDDKYGIQPAFHLDYIEKFSK